jgi:hypothetical protein
MESEHQAESKKGTSFNLIHQSEQANKAFEKSLERLENIVKLIKYDVNELSNKPIIDSGSDTIISEDYAKSLGLKIDSNQSGAMIISSEEFAGPQIVRQNN